jgi:hypothetical protein
MKAARSLRNCSLTCREALVISRLDGSGFGNVRSGIQMARSCQSAFGPFLLGGFARMAAVQKAAPFPQGGRSWLRGNWLGWVESRPSAFERSELKPDVRPPPGFG